MYKMPVQNRGQDIYGDVHENGVHVLQCKQNGHDGEKDHLKALQSLGTGK